MNGRHRYVVSSETDARGKADKVYKCRKCGHTVEKNPARYGCTATPLDEKNRR